MKELYIKTENGNVRIDQEQIKKYHLDEGTISPFHAYHIVDKNGDEHLETPKREFTSQQNPEHLPNGVVFTTSEILDIAEGVDSETVQT